MSNIIGMDIDGVLADFNTGYRKTIMKRFPQFDIPECGTDFPDCWDWESKYGLTKAQENEVWEQDILNSAYFWHELPPYPWTILTLKRLQESKHDVYFITSRSGRGKVGQTMTWLGKHTCGWAKFNVLVVPNHRKKVDILRGLGITHYLDDRLATMYYMADKVDTELYLLNQPWNQTAEDGNWHRINKITTFLIEAGV